MKTEQPTDRGHTLADDRRNVMTIAERNIVTFRL